MKLRTYGAVALAAAVLAGCSTSNPPPERAATRALALEGAESEVSERWSRAIGNALDERELKVAVDSLGNTLVAGTYTGLIDFGQGPRTGAGNLFVAKYDRSGAHVWTASFGAGPRGGRFLSVAGVVVDAKDRVIVAGAYGGVVTIGGNTLLGGGSGTVFLAKLEPTGAPVWSTSLPFNEVTALSIDPGGNPSIAGRARNNQEIYVSKLTSGGAPLWLQRFPVEPYFLDPNGLASDSVGNTILTGRFTERVSVGGNSQLFGDFAGDAFVAKYSVLGELMWAKILSDGHGPRDEGRAVAVDARDNIYVVGEFSSPLPITTPPVPNPTRTPDVFVAKLSPSGETEWARGFGGAGVERAGAVALDALGNVLVTGSYEQTADFGGESLTSAGSSDVFLVKLDPASGTLLQSRGYGDAAPQHATFVGARSAGDTRSDSLVLAGWFEGTISFDGQTLTSAGAADRFVAQVASSLR